MALSDCEKCWDTPCECGNYIGVSIPTAAHEDFSPLGTLAAMRSAGYYHGPNEVAYGDYSPNRYAIPVRNPQRCEPLGPVRGSLGLWRWAGRVSWRKQAA